MRYVLLACGVLGCAAGWGPAATAQQMQPVYKISAVAQTPEWQAIKSLAGQWEGFADAEGGKKAPAAVEMRVTGDGSAVMHVAAKNTAHEMVTMFHPDGDRLLATHYCAAHNQPRMAMVKGQTPNQIRFEFVDGTNIKPGELHMNRLVMTIVDADHHDEAWTSVADGKELPPAVFHYTRKK